LNLDKLKSLDMAYNRLESFYEFPGSEVLESVIISYNRITTMGNLSRCSQIKNLDIKNNKLTEVPEEIFSLEGTR
jgi:Leucine-rich repeat (LRR) protein